MSLDNLTSAETLQWISLGMAVRRGIRARGEATMYSYNGVVLPKLPEHDPAKHPCLTLYDATGLSPLFYNYRVYFSAGYIVTEFDGYSGIGLSKGDNDITSYTCAVRKSDGVIVKDWTYESNTYIDGYAVSNTLRDDIRWTNTDIVLPDGTVYLAASEPVPVYE